MGLSAVLFMSGVAGRVERMQLSATGVPEATLRMRPVAGTDELGQLAVAIEEHRQETARTADRLRLAIRAARIEVVEIRPELDGLTVFRSGTLFRHLGYPPDRLPTTLSGFVRMIHPDDRERVAEALRNVSPGWEYEVEFRMDAAGVDWRWVELRGAAPQLAPDEIGPAHGVAAFASHAVAVGILLDVTERRTAEDQARLAMMAADRANQAKSEFLSRMSHELRTPLNAVLGFAQLLEIDALTPDQKESVGHILRGGRYLLDLINEVLDLARIEAGRLGLSLEPVLVRDVIDAVVTLVGPQAADFGVRLQVPAHVTSEFVHADRQRLQQVLLNLVSNAIKYNRQSGTVELATEVAGGTVRIHVQDTGPGLAADQIERLFHPFERLDAARTGVEGTGLGLALSRTIVEAMGGRILVESTMGVGSTFTVELDAGEVTDEHRATLAPFREPATPVTVVYVEDNQANIRLVERIANRRPRIRIVSVDDGDRALGTIRKEQPSLVLLDLNLPGLQGDRILEQIRSDPSTADLPVAILSADATPAQAARLRTLGAQHYLTKPIDVTKLLEVLDVYSRDGGTGIASPG
jgi:signal transduction histidine kinase/ActR/RegA family two-component response regulator